MQIKNFKEKQLTDKEKFIVLLETADIEYEEWNDHLITIDDGLVEVHFDADGILEEIIGAATG